MKLGSAKWNSLVSALALVFMVMLGLFLFDDTPGLAGAFSSLSGYAQDAVQARSIPGEPPELNWLTGILLGLLLGGLSGALIDNSWKPFFAFEEESKFGINYLRTALFGIIAGFLFMLGALIAGESFFGQFAAAMELSPGAWLFLIAMVTTGGITALLKSHGGNGANGGGEEKK